jgi:hypothetical protein
MDDILLLSLFFNTHLSEFEISILVMSSFWSKNPCVPSWTERVGMWWNSHPPKLVEPFKTNLFIQPVAGCRIQKATVKEASLIEEFLGRYFSVSKACRCVLPASLISECIQDNSWEVYLVIRESNQELVGTGVRKWLQNVHIKQTFWNQAAIIDYFCVHPAYRKKGVGRWILTTLHNTAPNPLPPHFILWEGVQVKIPPIASGLYYSKKRLIKKSISCEKVIAPNNPFSGKDIYSGAGKQREVSFYKVPSGIISVWNTFHRSIPDGLAIGIILTGSQKAIDEFSDCGPYGVLLANYAVSEGWTLDSPYQWVTYNLSGGFLSTDYPCFLI